METVLYDAWIVHWSFLLASDYLLYYTVYCQWHFKGAMDLFLLMDAFGINVAIRCISTQTHTHSMQYWLDQKRYLDWRVLQTSEGHLPKTHCKTFTFKPVKPQRSSRTHTFSLWTVNKPLQSEATRWVPMKQLGFWVWFFMDLKKFVVMCPFGFCYEYKSMQVVLLM